MMDNSPEKTFEQGTPQESVTASQKPVLTDGVGLSIEEVRSLLMHQHETLVAKDDPILMIVTMLNAYLSEIEKQHQRLQEGMTKLLADKTQGYIEGVKTTTEELSERLSSASVERMKTMLSEHSKSLQLVTSNTIWLALIVGVSAIINVAAFAALALR